MNNSNSKFFIVLALILGGVVAFGQVFMVFFAGKDPETITADSIRPLPETLDVQQLDAFTERATKYLLLTPTQFEEGVDPAGLTPTPTPMPTN